MTDAEYIKTIPTLTNKELLEELDYCGYDSYYRTIREPVIEEITKRLNRIAELEKENAELKCECRRCVYSDCPCILSDYGKDRNGICDHFKDVFDEIVELKEKYDTCLRENANLKIHVVYVEKKLTKAKELLERLLITSCNSDVLNLLPNCSEVLRVRVEAEQFLSEVK